MTKSNESNRTSKSPDQIEAEIGQTRQVIGEDLRAIGEKLSAENLRQEASHFADEAKEKVKETIKETVTEVKDAAVDKMRETKDRVVERVHEYTDSAVETAAHAGDVTMSFVRQNAVPLSLIGIGIGWMIASNRRRRTREEWMPPRRTRRADRSMNGRNRAYGEYVDYETDREGEFDRDRQTGGIRAQAGKVVGEIEERGHQLKERAQHAMSSGMHRARDIGNRAKHGLHEAEVRSRDFALDNPLVIGAAAVAAGVGVGLLLPSTAKEDDLLGKTRDRLVDQAREGVEELGRGLKETSKEVASALRE